MAASSFVQVPEGMSPVNALYALYQRGENVGLFAARPDLARDAELEVFPDALARLFYEKSPCSLYMDYVGGRLVKVFFDVFPRLCVARYDEKYGPGEAERVIRAYAEVPSGSRFDSGDRWSFAAFFARNPEMEQQLWASLKYQDYQWSLVESTFSFKGVDPRIIEAAQGYAARKADLKKVVWKIMMEADVYKRARLAGGAGRG